MSDIKRFRTAWDFGKSPTAVETFLGKSEAVPGGAYSVKDLLMRFQRGDMPPVLQHQMYTEDYGVSSLDQTPWPKSPDLTDMDFNSMTINELKKKIKDELEKNSSNGTAGNIEDPASIVRNKEKQETVTDTE